MTFTMSEAESRRILSRHGVPVSAFLTATTTDEAISMLEGSEDVTFPVVVKLCGRSIAHKSERGLVRLRIPDVDSLRVACDELIAAAIGSDGPVELLVTSMVDGTRELIAGVTRDPQFGTVLMLGVGGVLAEAVRDVAFRLVPISRVDADELIDDLASQRMFGGVRGQPAVHRDALIDALLSLAGAATEIPGLVSIDLNPLIISDGLPIVVDALLEVDDPTRVA